MQQMIGMVSRTQFDDITNVILRVFDRKCKKSRTNFCQHAMLRKGNLRSVPFHDNVKDKRSATTGIGTRVAFKPPNL